MNVNDPFKPIIDTLVTEGFHQLTEKKELQGKPLDFKITPYSLNTKLSFKFENLDHFKEFLKISEGETPEAQIALLDATFLQLGLDADNFFYVNFFEKGKETEM